MNSLDARRWSVEGANVIKSHILNTRQVVSNPKTLEIYSAGADGRVVVHVSTQSAQGHVSSSRLMGSRVVGGNAHKKLIERETIPWVCDDGCDVM